MAGDCLTWYAWRATTICAAGVALQTKAPLGRAPSVDVLDAYGCHWSCGGVFLRGVFLHTETDPRESPLGPPEGPAQNAGRGSLAK
jgi:hypothetical protein